MAHHSSLEFRKDNNVWVSRLASRETHRGSTKLGLRNKETADICPPRLSPVLFSSSKSGHEASVKVSRGFQGAFWLSSVVQCKTHARLGQHWFYGLFAIDFHRQTAESFCIPSPLVSFSRLHFVIVSDCIYARKKHWNTQQNRTNRCVFQIFRPRSGARCVGASMKWIALDRLLKRGARGWFWHSRGPDNKTVLFKC